MKSLHAKSRDNARTPMQWDDSENAGFTEGTPWIAINENYKTVNVKNEMADEDSVLNYYRKLIKIRKEEKAIVHGDFVPLLEDNNEVVAYERNYGSEKLLIICNFYGRDRIIEVEDIDESRDKVKVLISNYKDSDVSPTKIHLRPYEAIIYKIDRIVL